MAAGPKLTEQLKQFDSGRSTTPTFNDIKTEMFSDDPDNAVRKNVVLTYGNAVQSELASKSGYRKFLLISIMILFLGITVVVFVAVFNKGISDNIKLALIGGFFTNFVGLLIIVFKYAFSRTSELYQAISDLIGK